MFYMSLSSSRVLSIKRCLKERLPKKEYCSQKIRILENLPVVLSIQPMVLSFCDSKFVNVPSYGQD